MHRKKQHLIKVAAGIIVKNDQVLIAKRPSHLHQGGLWEFPGGKIEAEETAEIALARELKEELNITIEQCEFYKQIDHCYEDKSVRLVFFKVLKFSGSPLGQEGQRIQWAHFSRLDQYDFPMANRIIVQTIGDWVI